MRRTPFIAACVFVFIWITVFVAGAQAPPAPAGVQTDALRAEPKRLSQGDVVEVGASGCAPGSDVTVRLYAPQLLLTHAAKAGGAGEFAERVRIPDTTAPGRAWLRAQCQTDSGGERIFDATVVVVRPRLVITWINVVFGTGVATVATGFGLAIRRRPMRRRRRRHRETSISIG